MSPHRCSVLVLAWASAVAATPAPADDPKDAAGFYHRGTAWLDKKEYDKAIKDFDEAVRLDPTDASSFHNRGVAWSGKGEHDKAVRDYDEAIRLDPRNPHAFVSRGNARADKREYDRAVKDYDEAVRLDPKGAPGYGNRAAVRAKLGRYDEAVGDFEAALRLDPRAGSVYRDYAHFRSTCPDAKYRDGAKALELARKAVELAGPDADWRYSAALAAAHAEVGEFDRAVAEQKKVLADKSLDREDRAKMEARLKLYEQKKPFRDE
jgi:tetratricopeptide (TPR) repeat protein